jgi:hypothetical protein
VRCCSRQSSSGQWTPSYIENNGHADGVAFVLAAGHGYLLFSDKALAGFTLQAPLQASAVVPCSQPAQPGEGGGALPPLPPLPGQH